MKRACLDLNTSEYRSFGTSLIRTLKNNFVRIKRQSILFILLILITTCVFSQEWEENDIIDDPTQYSPASPSIPKFKSTDVIKYLRVNVHYILKDDGTGNFAKDWDGVNPSNSYNGYKHAEELIYYCNNALANNQLMRLQPTPPVPALPINYRYVLNGVFFHEDTDLYENGGIGSLGYFTKNNGAAINLFLSTWGNGGGVAYLKGSIAEAHGHYNNYLRYLSDGVWWNITNGFDKIVNHEIGHNLSLYHPTRKNQGACCDGITASYCDDNCEDTPTWEELHNRGIVDPCCWGGQYCSNNLMDYNADCSALTPCQISTIHSHIENFKTTFYPCFYTSALYSRTSNIYQNESIIARKVTIPAAYRIKVTTGNALYINTELFEINGEFEVEKGSILVVNITPACN